MDAGRGLESDALTPPSEKLSNTHTGYITGFRDTIRYLLDNNLIENSIRPIAIGRKNYLFCKNDDAAEDAAIIYIMMGCCKAARADFRKWTTYFLEYIHEYEGDYPIPQDEFLPATLKERSLV